MSDNGNIAADGPNEDAAAPAVQPPADPTPQPQPEPAPAAAQEPEASNEPDPQDEGGEEMVSIIVETKNIHMGNGRVLRGIVRNPRGLPDHPPPVHEVPRSFYEEALDRDPPMVRLATEDDVVKRDKWVAEQEAIDAKAGAKGDE